MKFEFSNLWRRLVARSRVALTVAAVCLPFSLSAQEGFASLEEQMTGDEFRSAGLEKLTPEELASLNAWIRSRSLATLDAPRYGAAPSMGRSQLSDADIDEMKREPIVSRINGNFSGWDGQTIFRLENGMIWAQDDNDKFYTQEMQNPTVRIEPTLFGGWQLSVEGIDEECDVERIQ